MQLETLFCPCCTPALLYSLAQSNPSLLPRQLMLLGTETLTSVIARKGIDKVTKKMNVSEECS